MKASYSIVSNLYTIYTIYLQFTLRGGQLGIRGERGLGKNSYKKSEQYRLRTEKNRVCSCNREKKIAHNHKPVEKKMIDLSLGKHVAMI